MDGILRFKQLKTANTKSPWANIRESLLSEMIFVSAIWGGLFSGRLFFRRGLFSELYVISTVLPKVEKHLREPISVHLIDAHAVWVSDYS